MYYYFSVLKTVIILLALFDGTFMPVGYTYNSNNHGLMLSY